MSATAYEIMLTAEKICRECGLDPANISDENRREFIRMALAKLRLDGERSARESAR